MPADLATLSALKARVGAATGRSSDMEAHLICALAAPEGCFVTRGPISGDYRVCVGQTSTGRDLAWAGWAYWRDRNVMGDIGAALALVEEAAPGWQWLVRNREDGQYLANLRPAGTKPNEGDPCWPAWASTAPLAILSALLTAKIAQLEVDHAR